MRGIGATAGGIKQDFLMHPGYELWREEIEREIGRLIRMLVGAKEPMLVYELQGRIRALEDILSKEFAQRFVGADGGMEQVGI